MLAAEKAHVARPLDGIASASLDERMAQAGRAPP